MLEYHTLHFAKPILATCAGVVTDTLLNNKTEATQGRQESVTIVWKPDSERLELTPNVSGAYAVPNPNPDKYEVVRRVFTKKAMFDCCHC